MCPTTSTRTSGFRRKVSTRPIESSEDLGLLGPVPIRIKGALRQSDLLFEVAATRVDTRATGRVRTVVRAICQRPSPCAVELAGHQDRRSSSAAYRDSGRNRRGHHHYHHRPVEERPAERRPVSVVALSRIIPADRDGAGRRAPDSARSASTRSRARDIETERQRTTIVRATAQPRRAGPHLRRLCGGGRSSAESRVFVLRTKPTIRSGATRDRVRTRAMHWCRRPFQRQSVAAGTVKATRRNRFSSRFRSGCNSYPVAKVEGGSSSTARVFVSRTAFNCGRDEGRLGCFLGRSTAASGYEHANDGDRYRIGV